MSRLKEVAEKAMNWNSEYNMNEELSDISIYEKKNKKGSLGHDDSSQ